MAKKKTLDQKIDALTDIVEKGFAAVANDIDRLEEKMATKDQVVAVQVTPQDVHHPRRHENGQRLAGNVR